MKQTFLLLTLWLFAATAMAQSPSPQVIASSGSYTTNGTIALSTTVGEPVTATLTVANTSLTQGFQQPEYDVISSLMEAASKSLLISVYPNPTESNITVNIVSDDSDSALLTVVDMLGKILHQQKLVFNSVNGVSLSRFASGQYAFKITDLQGNLLSTHQIQKIH